MSPAILSSHLVHCRLIVDCGSRSSGSCTATPMHASSTSGSRRLAVRAAASAGTLQICWRPLPLPTGAPTYRGEGGQQTDRTTAAQPQVCTMFSTLLHCRRAGRRTQPPPPRRCKETLHIHRLSSRFHRLNALSPAVLGLRDRSGPRRREFPGLPESRAGLGVRRPSGTLNPHACLGVLYELVC